MREPPNNNRQISPNGLENNLERVSSSKFLQLHIDIKLGKILLDLNLSLSGFDFKKLIKKVLNKAIA